MSQTAFFSTVKKVFGTAKMSRYMDGGEWVTDGMIAIKKEFEPHKYAKLRFTGDLGESSKQSLEKTLNDFAAEPKIRLFFPEIIKLDPNRYTPSKIFKPNTHLPLKSRTREDGSYQLAVVNAQYIALFFDNKKTMRMADILEFWQKDGANLSPVFITTLGGEKPLAIVMPVLVSNEEVAIYDN